MTPHAATAAIAGGLRAEKAALRLRLRAEVKEVTAEERRTASALVCARLREQPFWRQARHLLFYASLPDELDLWPLIEEALRDHRTVALPRFLVETGAYGAAVIQNPTKDLVKGKLGILEPSSHCRWFALNQLDLVLVPGVGFDVNGRRLGRGKGYYDRLLPSVGGIRCGVAMDRQVLPAIPAEPHDVMLDCILTPSCLLTFGRHAV